MSNGLTCERASGEEAGGTSAGYGEKPAQQGGLAVQRP